MKADFYHFQPVQKVEWNIKSDKLSRSVTDVTHAIVRLTEQFLAHYINAVSTENKIILSTSNI